MTSPSKLNEYNHAEEPALRLLERLGWTYVPRDALAAERGDERQVLLKRRLQAALLRLNQWMTEEQADRVIFELEHIDALGMLRNQRVHEYLTYGMPLTVDRPEGRRTRTIRFFDFDHPEGGLNEFVVTTQFRVRRGRERGGPENDERMVIPDLVLFVNGIPLVVMEAKSPSLLDVWKTKAVRQLRRYQEAGPEWHGSGAPELFYYNLLCVAHCGASAVYAAQGASETAYFEWKSVLPYSEDEVRDRFGFEPKGQAQLIVGLLSPATLMDILRDYVVYEPERGHLVKKLPRYQQYRAVCAAVDRMLTGRKPDERGGVVWHTQGSGKSLTMLWLATKLRREPRLGNPTIVVVTDRRQLDRQISETFKRCGFPAPEQAVFQPRLAQASHHRRRPHHYDNHPEVRAGIDRARRRTRRAQSFGKRHSHGGRGAPHPVRHSGRANVQGIAQRRSGWVHRHPHRQGVQAQHYGPVRWPNRLLHHPAIRGRRRDGAHLLRGASARTGH